MIEIFSVRGRCLSPNDLLSFDPPTRRQAKLKTDFANLFAKSSISAQLLPSPLVFVGEIQSSWILA
jgi:hypothetical protein